MALYALVLNAAWEFFQCLFLYDMGNRGFWMATLWMWSAILGDVLIVGGVVYLANLLTGPHHMQPLDARGGLTLVVVGLAIGILLEWLARTLGLWTYSSLMPTIDILDQRVGVAPIFQIAVLPAVSMTFASRG